MCINLGKILVSDWKFLSWWPPSWETSFQHFLLGCYQPIIIVGDVVCCSKHLLPAGGFNVLYLMIAQNNSVWLREQRGRGADFAHPRFRLSFWSVCACVTMGYFVTTLFLCPNSTETKAQIRQKQKQKRASATVFFTVGVWFSSSTYREREWCLAISVRGVGVSSKNAIYDNLIKTVDHHHPQQHNMIYIVYIPANPEKVSSS